MRALILVMLAGCGLIQSNSSSTLPAPGQSPSSGGGSAPPSATGGGDPSGMVTMPNLVGMTVDQAAAAVRNAGFRNELEHSTPVECANPPAVAEGHIKCQSEDAGAKVRAYTLIQVSIQKTQHLEGQIVRAQLKPLVGMKLEDAKNELRRLGYQGQVRIETPVQFYGNCPLGTVCEVSPASGVGVDASESITFVMNKDAVKISTPDN